MIFTILFRKIYHIFPHDDRFQFTFDLSQIFIFSCIIKVKFINQSDGINSAKAIHLKGKV